jgi:hypothetical protein
MLFKSNICSEKKYWVQNEEQAERADVSTPASRAKGRHPSQEHRAMAGPTMAAADRLTIRIDAARLDLDVLRYRCSHLADHIQLPGRIAEMKLSPVCAKMDEGFACGL